MQTKIDPRLMFAILEAHGHSNACELVLTAIEQQILQDTNLRICRAQQAFEEAPMHEVEILSLASGKITRKARLGPKALD